MTQIKMRNLFMKKKPDRSTNKKTQYKDCEKYLDDVDLWDSRKLGADIRYAERTSEAEDKAVDDALGLQAISIRLQKSLVKQLKALAGRDGIGYQPYIRQILTRHARENRTASKRAKAS
jgi:predicted DNA binding CopG/RHH family protein